MCYGDDFCKTLPKGYLPIVILENRFTHEQFTVIFFFHSFISIFSMTVNRSAEKKYCIAVAIQWIVIF